jgi:hypothetical protein
MRCYLQIKGTIDMTVDFDPNLNLSGNASTKTVKLTFGLWDYRAEETVNVGGNTIGLSNISHAVEKVYDQNEGRITLTKEDGDRLLCEDEEDYGEDWLADMLVAAEIIDIQPSK